MKRFIFTASVFIAGVLAFAAQPPASDPLRLEVYVADSNSFCVTSTLITGAHEALLVDAQFRKSDAVRLADRISKGGKTLKAIFISHPDDDHYLCMAVFRQRFPNTPIYMSPAGLKEFERTSAKYLKMMKAYSPLECPDSLPVPELLPTTHLSVDGVPVEAITDIQGDTWTPSNSYLWIPSLHAVVAGDLVFNGVHPWLANSNRRSRSGWLNSLDQLEALHPDIVVAGHKRDDTTPDSPDIIAGMRKYLKAFDGNADIATGSDDLVARMKQEFPALSVQAILTRSAKVAIPD
jgi:glyoxylase-like metal-dependent hydrolase (beta-lactamase superfamily II)